jgi:hypothetical protein
VFIEVITVEAYANWMGGFSDIASDESYTIKTSSLNDSTNTAIFLLLSLARIPVMPGLYHQPTRPHILTMSIVLKMNDDGKIASMAKIWNAPWALKKLGWM